MTAELQTTIALLVVACVVVGFVVRGFAKRHKPGCGGDCGCSSTGFKTRFKP